MSKLIIGKPKIEKVNNNYRLVSEIKRDRNKKYDLWFEVEKEYKKYLCTENCDSFLVALIPYIVKHETDVVVDGSISSQLYYQLNTYLFPLLCKAYNKKIIKIKCEISNEKFKSMGVGSSISCGVDSFYTLFKHSNCKDKNYNITHLTFFNAGSHGEFGGTAARELYNKRLNYIKKFCKEYKYKLVTVDSNMNEFIRMNHLATHSFRTLSCVLALQKLFGKYYFANSGIEFDDIHLSSIDSAYYDILNVECLSNQNTTFYTSGIEATRLEKIKYLVKFKETYNWLNVCIAENDEKNCSLCEKCIRTMVALESIDKLEKYKNVFNLDLFYNHRVKIYKEALKKSRNKETNDYYIETIENCKKNGIHIPISSYILSYIPTLNDIKSFLKRHLPKKALIKIQKKRGTYEDDGWI